VIAVEQAKDGLVCRFPVPVLKNLYVRILWDGALDASRELNRFLVRIVVAHKTADETNDNAGCRCRGACGHRAVGGKSWRCCGEHGGGHRRKRRNRNPKSREASQAGS